MKGNNNIPDHVYCNYMAYSKKATIYKLKVKDRYNTKKVNEYIYK